MKTKEKNAEKLEMTSELDVSARLWPFRPCYKPCHFFQYKVENDVGGQHSPFHWIVNVGGYPFINVVVQFRGDPNKYYQVQLRHHHPLSTVGPTVTFVFASDSGNLPAGGFDVVTFSGVRPLQPEVDIIAFSNSDDDFEVVTATVYATVA